jgi:hypothetical protein
MKWRTELARKQDDTFHVRAYRRGRVNRPLLVLIDCYFLPFPLDDLAAACGQFTEVTQFRRGKAVGHNSLLR